MNTNELKLTIPEGHEIDIENSNLSQGIIKFKKKDPEYPTKYTDLYKVSGYYITTWSELKHTHSKYPNSENLNIFPEEDQAIAILALAQLLQLRARYLLLAGYSEEWRPDVGKKVYYSIENADNTSIIKSYCHVHRILSFPTKELAELFHDNFKDTLIKEALILI